MEADLDELERELGWFTRLLDHRFRDYFSSATGREDTQATGDPFADPPPDLSGSTTAYARFIHAHAPALPERAAVVLALVAPLRPQLLDVFFTRNATFDRRFTEFGGLRTDDEFEPTGETLAFVLGGGSVAARVAATHVLDPERPLLRSGVLRLGSTGRDLTPLKAPLRLASDHLALFTTGRRSAPPLGPEFPAQRIETALEWDDLILHRGTLEQLQEIHKFVVHGDTLMHGWGMAARLRPGLRALFHGPPGTGKTMSAALLGKASDREVYRVDLSLVVSKYIGETEKNLARVFDSAQQRGWILFFDEADALFGKRGESKDAHDRYANQEVAYLLQRIESFEGIALLASNLRENLDDAFTRRFELVVYFPLPRPPERRRLWQRGFSAKAKLGGDIDFDKLAHEHELSGGSIMNVIRQVSLTAIAEGEREIVRDDLIKAIRRELAKEGKSA
jgi:hypothetical protein